MLLAATTQKILPFFLFFLFFFILPVFPQTSGEEPRTDNQLRGEIDIAVPIVKDLFFTVAGDLRVFGIEFEFETKKLFGREK